MKCNGTPTYLDLESLLPAVIFGAEGEGEGEGEGSDNGAEGSENGEDEGDAGSGNSSDNEHDDANDPKVIGLKNALATERKRAEAAEKARKAAQKKLDDAALKDKSEIEQAQIRERQATERAEKLAAGFVRTSIDAAIEKAARDMKFIDPSDAVSGVERKNIEFTQDDDDPSRVEVDLKTVTAAVKALAARKAHFISSGTDDGEPTGGQFGRGNQQKKKTSEETFKEKYPALSG